jgi:hypothetical protein
LNTISLALKYSLSHKERQFNKNRHVIYPIKSLNNKVKFCMSQPFKTNKMLCDFMTKRASLCLKDRKQSLALLQHLTDQFHCSLHYSVYINDITFWIAHVKLKCLKQWHCRDKTTLTREIGRRLFLDLSMSQVKCKAHTKQEFHFVIQRQEFSKR